MFALLFLIYFVMSYLLIGAAYLILGAQASTQRELQMMSLPMTFVQMGMVGLATAAAAQSRQHDRADRGDLPVQLADGDGGAGGQFVRACGRTLLAIAWQLLWVSVVISLGARWFRRGVLKSGGGPKRAKDRLTAPLLTFV